MKECLGDEFLICEQVLEKLRMLTKLLKKREGDDIRQVTHGIHMRENRDDTWERTAESREIVGTKTINHEGVQLEARLIDAVRRI